MIRLLADIAGTIGMLLFLMAELRQFYKIKITGKLTGLSFHAYLSKLIAVMSTGVCFAITGLYFSLLVIVAEGIVIIPVMYWLWKYRKRPHENYKTKMSCLTTDTKVSTSNDAIFDLWDNRQDVEWEKQ